VILAAIFGAIAGLLFGFQELHRRNRTWLVWAGLLLSGALIVAGVLVVANPPALFDQQLSPYKTLSILSQTKDAKHTVSDSDASSRVDVIESSAIHIMPGLSLLSPARPPQQAGLMLDGDSLMPITNLAPDSEQAHLLAAYTPNSLAYHLRPASSTLVIEAGTGMDVLLSLAAGAAQVTAVEENDLLLETVQEEYGELTHHLYRDPRVTVVNQSSRVFARQQASSGDETGYTVVIVALTEPHRPVTSGAFSLTEDYIYTVDAFRDYLQLLSEDGLLIVTRWLQAPPSESGRTFGILVEALQEKGLDPAKHVIAYRTLRTITFVTSLLPFTSDDIATVRDYLEGRNYDSVYFPGIVPEELNQNNVLEEPVYHQLLTEILADPETTYETTGLFTITISSGVRPLRFLQGWDTIGSLLGAAATLSW